MSLPLAERLWNILVPLSDLLWSDWTFYLLLGSGALFTLWTRFSQFTALTHGVAVVRGIYDDKADPGAINHFQALSAALSATVGLGNIGGVALALGTGGPGALFWIWITGFFGMALKTVEVTLALAYRQIDKNGEPHGGAMWVVENSLGKKGGIWTVLARLIGGIFCVTLLVSTITGGNMFQVWNVSDLSQNYFHVPPLVTSIVMAVLTGLVILGGIRRIGDVAGYLAPVMCLTYVLAGLAVIFAKWDQVPEAFRLIVRSAFSPTEATGAFLGGTAFYAFSIGVRRALFSNEAGQGSAPIAHSAAKTGEAAREGYVAGLEPFLDTITICTITALVIILTGVWNRPAFAHYAHPVELVVEHTDQGGTTFALRATNESTDPKNGERSPLAATVEALDENGAAVVLEPDSPVFLLAEVPGGDNRKTKANRFRISGRVSKQGQIEWSTTRLGHEDWEGNIEEARLLGPELFRDYDGASLTAHAFNTQFNGLGKWLVTLVAFMFAVSTMISWSYYGEQGAIYLLGAWSVVPYKIAFLVVAAFTPLLIADARAMEVLIDLGTGLMLWSNMPILLAMGAIAVFQLERYKRRLRQGEFHPHAAPPITDVMEGRDVE